MKLADLIVTPCSVLHGEREERGAINHVKVADEPLAFNGPLWLMDDRADGGIYSTGTMEECGGHKSANVAN